MAKKLVFDYTFSAADQTVTLTDDIYPKRRLLLITNVTDGEVIYQFNDPDKGGTFAFDYTNFETTITLEHDTTSMDDADDLQIFVEWDNQSVEVDESYVDPVSKIRVSQPENLIDTDFEYGLQSTKWETLELTNNIPTFYSRNGDLSFELEFVQTRENSDIITVKTTTAHGLLRGTPILVQGTASVLADGGFTTLSIVDDNTFTYQAKSTFASTGDISSINTQIFQGSIYSGTEFKLTAIGGITSDGASPSTLTVTTEYPTDFEDGTTFALTNSFATTDAELDTGDVITDNETSETINITIAHTTNEKSNNRIIQGSTVDPYNWIGRNARSIYINPDECTASGGDIVFNSDHGRYTSDLTYQIFPFYYNIPSGATPIGGMTRGRFYVGRYINSTTLRVWRGWLGSGFYSYPHNNSGSYRINISSMPSYEGIKHQFLGGWITYRNGTSDWFDSATSSSTYDWNWHSTAFNSRSTASNNSNYVGSGRGQHLIMSEDGTTSSVDGGGKFTRYSSIGNFESLSTGSSQVHYIWSADGEDTHYPSRNGRSRMSLGNDTNDDIHVPVSLNSNRNTFYKEDHGLAENDRVTYTVTSGTGPSGPSSGTNYLIRRVSADRFGLKTLSGSEVNFTSHGTMGAVLSFAVKKAVVNADTILTSASFNEGDPVTYTVSNGGTAIGGLTDGTTYYVFNKAGSRFSLASNAALYTGVEFTAGTGASGSNGIDVANNEVNRSSHGLTTGRGVLYTNSTSTTNGLKSGFIYFARSVTSNAFSLHPTAADANANTNKIALAAGTGTSTYKETYIVDLTSTPASDETHTLSGSFVGAADGNYVLASTAADQKSFTLTATAEINGRKITTTVQESFIADLDAFYFKDHGFALGADAVYTSTTSQITGLTSGTKYYVIPLDRDTFQLATSSDNAESKTQISLSENATSSSAITDEVEFQGASIVAAAAGEGSVTVDANSKLVQGEGTLFSALFKAGDTIKISSPKSTYAAQNNTGSASTSGDTIAVTGHGLTSGAAVYFTGSSLPTPIVTGRLYFVNAASDNTLTLHYTNGDATADSNVINITSAGGGSNSYQINPIDSENEVIERTVDYVNSNELLEVTEEFSSAISDGTYYVNSSLLLRPDGFALHRPYDGGVELIPPSNPDSQMIRQTRKYFRYQSGKGIQVSFAVNFSPTTQIDDAFYTNDGDLTIKTRFPHRLTTGLEIEVTGATGPNESFFNGTRTVSSVTDDYTAVFDTGETARKNEIFAGNAEFYVKGWRNSQLKCGLFDDQNGIFFEYDGDRLFCCRRSSIKQISGTAEVTFRSGDVEGTNTKFLSQLAAGNYVVIKGQSYLITKVESDTKFHIAPSYRGTSETGVIITETETAKVPQEDWSLDKADGTGYTGFYLDKSKIQMAYVDYSWYGAGKVRFGFKDQHGKVQYVHEFVHGNFKTEAYMRSGNIPARYEIQNTGTPTYVPALAHWGTSVIMDGRFDDDKAYVFNASGNSISLTGATSVTVSGRIETTSQYTQRIGRSNVTLARGILLSAPSSTLNQVFDGLGVSGAGLPSGTKLRLPASTFAVPYSPYMPSTSTRINGSFSTQSTRSLLLIDSVPTATSGSNSNYTLDLTEGDVDAENVTREIPLISVRLAPSVDTGTTGRLGVREIINRMQLILNQVSILTTHTVEIRLILNGQLSTNEWQRVANPSLSELLYHSGNDEITGGASLFSFRAAGDTGTTRAQQLTVQDLGDVATLGNSILGGDQPFPDGPDVLTVVATLSESPDAVTGSTPFIVSGRISWSESQA